MEPWQHARITRWSSRAGHVRRLGLGSEFRASVILGCRAWVSPSPAGSGSRVLLGNPSWRMKGQDGPCVSSSVLLGSPQTSSVSATHSRGGPAFTGSGAPAGAASHRRAQAGKHTHLAVTSRSGYCTNGSDNESHGTLQPMLCGSRWVPHTRCDSHRNTSWSLAVETTAPERLLLGVSEYTCRPAVSSCSSRVTADLGLPAACPARWRAGSASVDGCHPSHIPSSVASVDGRHTFHPVTRDGHARRSQPAQTSPELRTWLGGSIGRAAITHVTGMDAAVWCVDVSGDRVHRCHCVATRIRGLFQSRTHRAALPPRTHDLSSPGDATHRSLPAQAWHHRPQPPLLSRRPLTDDVFA